MATTPNPDGTDTNQAKPDSMRTRAESARTEVSSGSGEEVLLGVAELAKRSLGGVADVSLTLIDHGDPRTVVFTGRLAIDLDVKQYELGFGPCLDAAKTGQTIIVVTDDEQSPYREFGRTATTAGIHHTVSVGMPLAQRVVGCLNIYKAPASPVTPAFVNQAEVLASYAAIAMNNIARYAPAADEDVHHRVAMSRAVIDQATDILVARDRCTLDEASDLLKRIASSRNISIHHLARTIVDAA